MAGASARRRVRRLPMAGRHVSGKRRVAALRSRPADRCCDRPLRGLPECGVARTQAGCSMIYLSIKALHVASVITFVAGLLVLSICAATNNLVILRVMRRWDRRVTTPALAMVWITGPTI